MSYSFFETEIIVRPDDIDMNNHVHYSKYLDYLLAARYSQMKNNYKMSMEEFLERGFTWVASRAEIEFKRGLQLNDKVIVRTQLDNVNGAQVKVNFWIFKGANKKIAAEGSVVYTMISTKNGRPVRIPPDIIERYSV